MHLSKAVVLETLRWQDLVQEWPGRLKFIAVDLALPILHKPQTGEQEETEEKSDSKDASPEYGLPVGAQGDRPEAEKVLEGLGWMLQDAAGSATPR